MGTHIIPSVIPDSLQSLSDDLARVRGACGRVQLDVMDGTYASGRSWPYQRGDSQAFAEITREEEGLPFWQSFDFEIDLLLKEPEKQIELWALAGAACMVVHMGTTEKLSEIFEFGAQRRIEIALALRPGDDTAALVPWIDSLAFVQVMGNETIGFHGKPLDERAVKLVRDIHARFPLTPIGVDIGVSEDTLPVLCEAGASRFAVGSAIWSSSEPKRAIAQLEALAHT